MFCMICFMSYSQLNGYIEKGGQYYKKQFTQEELWAVQYYEKSQYKKINEISSSSQQELDYAENQVQTMALDVISFIKPKLLWGYLREYLYEISGGKKCKDEAKFFEEIGRKVFMDFIENRDKENTLSDKLD